MMTFDNDNMNMINILIRYDNKPLDLMLQIAKEYFESNGNTIFIHGIYKSSELMQMDNKLLPGELIKLVSPGKQKWGTLCLFNYFSVLRYR